MATTLEGLERTVLKEAENALAESNAHMKKEIAKDFSGEDLKNLPEYIKDEEEAYEKRQNTLQMLGMLTAGLVIVLIFFLVEVLKVPGQLIKSTIEYAAVGAFTLLVISIILLRLMPKNGKPHIIRIGKGNLEKEDKLKLYARLDVDERRTKER